MQEKKTSGSYFHLSLLWFSLEPFLAANLQMLFCKLPYKKKSELHQPLLANALPQIWCTCASMHSLFLLLIRVCDVLRVRWVQKDSLLLCISMHMTDKLRPYMSKQAHQSQTVILNPSLTTPSPQKNLSSKKKTSFWSGFFTWAGWHMREKLHGGVSCRSVCFKVFICQLQDPVIAHWDHHHLHP